jgi:hypothetical protein
MAKTVKVQAPTDDRLIHRSIRLPGQLDQTSGQFVAGEVIVDIERLQELLNAGTLSREVLLETGVISGNWSG